METPSQVHSLNVSSGMYFFRFSVIDSCCLQSDQSDPQAIATQQHRRKGNKSTSVAKNADLLVLKIMRIFLFKGCVTTLTQVHFSGTGAIMSDFQYESVAMAILGGKNRTCFCIGHL